MTGLKSRPHDQSCTNQQHYNLHAGIYNCIIVTDPIKKVEHKFSIIL